MIFAGTWKVRELRMPTPDGVKVYTPENLPPEDDEMYEESCPAYHNSGQKLPKMVP